MPKIEPSDGCSFLLLEMKREDVIAVYDALNAGVSINVIGESVEYKEALRPICMIDELDVDDIEEHNGS